MATLAELLASSLAALKQVQQSGDFTIVKSGELSPTHLKRLLANHFLMPVIKGWYIVTDPRAVPGDSTAWYASFWNFILRYATERYGKEWCLSAEQSLAIYSGSTTVPKQVLIRSPKGNNNSLELLPPTSLFNLEAALPSRIDTDNPYRLNLYPLAEAIIAATPAIYKSDATTMRTALALVRDSSEILKILVDTGQTVRAGRVIGAFRNIGRKDIADEIAATMKRIGYDVREEDPFEQVVEVAVATSPYATRLKLMWRQMREQVLADFTRAKSGLSPAGYLERMEACYKLDAYHSLSIEGYRVTDELIQKVRSGAWKPDGEDADVRNALAARGYWQAFQQVKKSVAEILGRRRRCGRRRPGSRNVAQRDVHALCHGRHHQGIGSCRIPLPSGIYPQLHAYAAQSRCTPRCHDDAVRTALGGAGCAGESCAGTFRIYLYPPLYGWKRPCGAFSDEHDACIGRVRLGDYSRRETRGIHVRARTGERSGPDRTFHEIYLLDIGNVRLLFLG